MRKSAYGLAVVVAAVIASPWLCGVVLEKKMQQYAHAQDDSQHVQITILKYQRGWTSSNVTLSVKVKGLFADKLDLAQFLKQPKSAEYQFTVEQHITHGPFVWNVPANVSTHFVLAAMKNKVQLAPETKAMLAPLGINENFLQASTTLMLLSGNYINYFKLNAADLRLNLPIGDGVFSLSGAEGYVWMHATKPNVSGDIKVHHVTLTDAENTVSMSEVNLQLNQYKSHSGIWLGSDAIVLPDFIFRTSDGEHIAVYGINLSGDLRELSGELSGYRQVSIDKLSFADQNFGPIDMRLSGEKLNLQTFQDMLTTYEDIREHGELYESQLQIKLSSLLPNVIKAGSRFQIDKLVVDSPAGNLEMDGELIWPEKDFISPRNMEDVIDTANLSVKLHIAKPLVNDLINYASTRPDLIRQVSIKDRSSLVALREQMEFAARQNVFLIVDFERQRIISSDAADTLLDLQKHFIPVDDYFSAVTKLYWSKDISLAAMYWLDWQYAQIQKPYNLLMGKVGEYQNKVKDEFQSQIKEWVTQQYVTEKNDSYSVLVTWSNGQLRLNGMVAK